MDNQNMFDELTNRLNKVKRPDSGIHNSGEFISENDKLDKSDEQADSGRDSDPAETADGSGPTKKGGILKSFKKIFKIRRRSKNGKMKTNEKVISSQYRAVSEPEMNTISSSSQEGGIPRSNTGMEKRREDSPNENDFMSDEEDNRTDEKKSSIKDVHSSFIRSSLRKFKMRKKKNGGMDSAEVTPTSVKKQNVGSPPPISPKKSPKKVNSSRSSHSSDATDPRSNNSFTNDLNTEAEDNVTDNLHKQHVVVDLNDDPLAWQPIIESSAAKDKIRIAPRGRKRPSRGRPQTKTADISNKKASLAQINENGVSDNAVLIESKNTVFSGLSKKAVKNVPKEATEDTPKTIIDDIARKTSEHTPRKNSENNFDANRKRDISKSVGDRIVGNGNDAKQKENNAIKNAKNIASVEETFDSFITSLESIGNTSESSIPKKSSPNTKPSAMPDTPLSKLQSRLEKGDTRRSRENIGNISDSRGNINSSRDITFEVRSVQHDDRERSLSLSLGDLIKSSSGGTSPTTRRSKSFKISNDIENANRQPKQLPDIIPLNDNQDDLVENNRYGKYRKHRSQLIPDNHDSIKQSPFSKSVEDISRLNKENKLRSSNYNEPYGSLIHNTSLRKSDENVRNSVENVRKSNENVRKSVENVRKSLEPLKKSSSRNSLNETTFAITSMNNIQDPVIPYGDKISNEIPATSPGKPRKLQKKATTGSKDDVARTTTRKSRPQSVKIISTDVSVILTKMTGAKSFGDVRSLSEMPDGVKSKAFPSISKKNKPLFNAGKSKSSDKPLLVNTGKSKSVDVQPVSINNSKPAESVTNGDNNMLVFKRMSLKKTPKTDDYLPKEPAAGDVVVVDNDVIEEHHVLASIKTTLKHVETKDVDATDVHDTRDERNEKYSDVERIASTDKTKHAPTFVESKASPVETTTVVETREAKDKAPEFHRISLKKVEKRDDYLEKEPAPTAVISADASDDLVHNAETRDTKRISSEHPVPSHELKGSDASDEDVHDKNKPSVKAKPFQFQSHDVKSNENKSQSTPEKPKPVPLAQTNKLPYFRKSIDIQENPNTNGVPAWIALARERQRDEESAHVEEEEEEEVVTEHAHDNDEVKAENLVKPSAMKPKPSPLPKPAAVQKPDSSSQISSSPGTAKKPPPVSQRPSLNSRFNAKTDLPKDACMVCGKTAYVLERCEVNKRTLHRSCARCHVCSRTLNLGDIFISDEKVMCKQHR